MAAAAADREKSLETALAQIDRQFGKGSVMRLGDEVRAPIETIPTGSIALDVALGIGGLPRGRVVEIYGPESSGKCLTADALVPTNWGLLTVGEIFEQCGEKASCTNRITDVSHLGLRVVNEHGGTEPVSALTHNNRKPVFRVATSTGKSVRVTANHPMRVLNERGFVVWRNAADLKAGDVLVGVLSSDPDVKDQITEREAILLGYLVGDGHYSRTESVMFSQVDAQVSAEFDALMAELAPDVTPVVYGQRPNDSWFRGKALRDALIERYGLTPAKAPQKSVPPVVRASGHLVHRAFLSALFECDGCVEGDTVTLSTASRQLADEVQAMLAGLGLVASIKPKKVAAYPDRTYWTVFLGNGSSVRFVDEVGFRSARRAAQVAGMKAGSRDGARHIPHLRELLRDLRDGVGGDRAFDRIAGDVFRDFGEGYGDLAVTPERLDKIVAWARERGAGDHPLVTHLASLAGRPATYERVVSVEAAGDEPTFDLVVPGTHSFVANGLAVHNTTVALHAVANAQKAGGIAAFIDAEHALDPDYAAKLGVDTDALLVSQPDTGEQALEIMDMLIRSGALDIIVVDSVAALVPRAEIEGEMGDSHVGLQARLMSQALRKITGALNQSGTTAIFINQLREKIGVLFGCGSYDTLVTLADGSQEQLGKIVEGKLPVEVLSYDAEADRIVPRRVINWFDNGETPEFLEFHVERAGGGTGRGKAHLTMTPNHLIRTPGGWREAADISVGDRVMLAQPHRLSQTQWQMVLGGLMGDAALSKPVNPEQRSARFRMGHGAKQVAYLDWKASMFGNIGQSRSVNAKGATFVDLTPLPELAELREAVYLAGHKVLSWDYLKALTPLAIAVWYMDDGSFTIRAKGLQERTKDGSGRSEICVQAMSPDSRERLVEHLSGQFDLHPRLAFKGTNKTPFLIFSKDETAKLHQLVAPYVHPSMEYKLLPRYQGQFAVEPEFVSPELKLLPARVLSVRARPPMRSMHRFDLEIEGTHNYLADGVMVHNSPETTTGGKALKFYSSVRLDVRRIETLKDGTEPVGNRTRVKVVKNKVSPPFRQAEFDILYGHGISREGGLIDMGVDHGFVRKSGAWYTYEGDQLGQGKENARAFLRDNPDLADEIEKRILEKLGIGAQVDKPVEDAVDGEPLPAPVDF